MPYDAGAAGAESNKSKSAARGPLRPQRLASARSRLIASALSRLMQAGDMALLATLFVFKGMPLSGVSLLLAAASTFVVVALVSFEAYQFAARERLHKHLYRVIGAVGGSAFMMLAVASL